MDPIKLMIGKGSVTIPMQTGTVSVLCLRPGGDMLVEVKITKAKRRKPRGASVVTAVYDELPPKEATDGN